MDEDLEANHEVAVIDHFSVFEGKQIFDFVNKAVLKSAQPICQLDTQKTSVFNFSEQGYGICVTESNDLMNTPGQITELLKPWLEKSKEVIAISLQPAFTFNTRKQFDKRYSVRSNSGRMEAGAKLPAYVEPMEDCNIVHGIKAGGEYSIELVP